jgi:tetratricopeptide (TPR) repeat protein
MRIRILLFACSLLAFAAVAAPQGTKGTGGSAPSANTSSQPSDPSKLMNRDWNNMNKLGTGGQRLVGNVAVTGAALPWDPISVSVTCNRKVSYTTTTDVKGYFAINLVKDKSPTAADAAQYAGCSVQAALPGFDSSSVTIKDRNVLDTPNIGTITLSRESNSEGSAVSATTAQAPKDAAKAYERARSDWLEKKPDRAEKDLQKAVQVYPQFAEAWYQLGRLQDVGHSPEAANSIAKAAAADPKFVPPHEYLADLAVQAQKWQDALDETKRVLELNPRGTVQILYYNALANFQLRNMKDAEASANKALAMDPLHQQPNTEQLLAVILTDRQDFADALQHLQNCLTYFPPGPNTDLVKEQIAQIEPAVKKKTTAQQ